MATVEERERLIKEKAGDRFDEFAVEKRHALKVLEYAETIADDELLGNAFAKALDKSGLLEATANIDEKDADEMIAETAEMTLDFSDEEFSDWLAREEVGGFDALEELRLALNDYVREMRAVASRAQTLVDNYPW